MKGYPSGKVEWMDASALRFCLSAKTHFKCCDLPGREVYARNGEGENELEVFRAWRLASDMSLGVEDEESI
jgi:hypothetical protein